MNQWLMMTLAEVGKEFRLLMATQSLHIRTWKLDLELHILQRAHWWRWRNLGFITLLQAATGH